MAAPSKPKPATAADLGAIPDHDRLEIVGGTIIDKAAPSPEHSFAESRLSGVLPDSIVDPGGAARVDGGS